MGNSRGNEPLILDGLDESLTSRVGGGNRFFLPAISFITDLLRPGDTIPPVITADSRPFGCRPAGRRQSQDRSELCSTHKSLSRNTVHRYQETPFNLT